MGIKTIFFDVGGTLIHPDLSQLMAPLYACVAPTEEQLKLAESAAKHAARPDEDRAAVDRSNNQGHWDVFFRALLDQLNGSLEQAGGSRDSLMAELVARANNSSFWTKADPVAAPTLECLRREYGLSVISNADGRISQVLARAGLGGYFNHITDSGLVGCEKPDPRIFRAALEAEGADPSESLYIGDIFAVDYQGATGVGMHAVLLDPRGTYCGWDVARLDSLDQLPAWVKSIN